jgi:hypothetical protein
MKLQQASADASINACQCQQPHGNSKDKGIEDRVVNIDIAKRNIESRVDPINAFIDKHEGGFYQPPNQNNKNGF